MWFGSQGSLTPDGTRRFDRYGHLKIVVFTLFCDDDYHLDYTDLLLLLSADPEAGNGVLKALSLVTQKVVDWPEYIESPDPSNSQRGWSEFLFQMYSINFQSHY